MLSPTGAFTFTAHFDIAPNARVRATRGLGAVATITEAFLALGNLAVITARLRRVLFSHVAFLRRLCGTFADAYLAT